MDCYELSAFGLDNLGRARRGDREPGPGEVRVRLEGASLNYRDLLLIQGTYNPKLKMPLIPLSDGAGIVEAVGEGVRRVQIGDRVIGSFCQRWLAGPVPRDVEVLKATLGGPLDGMLAETIALPEEGVVRAPAHLTSVEAATLPCAALTAWSAIVVQGELRPGDVLVVQGTGGVSLFALAFGKTLGATVIVTSKSDEKLERARALGADETINYVKTPEWGKAVRTLTGGGADQVIEVGGAGTLAQSVRAVRPGGHISIIGVLAGAACDFSVTPVLMQNLRLQGVIVGSRDELASMCRAMEKNDMHPVVDRVFAFAEARQAFEHLASGRHFGKVCVAI